MTTDQENKFTKLLNDISSKSYSFNGISFVSGANTLKGEFYGLSVGNTRPDSLKIVPKDNLKLNGAILQSSDDILEFLSSGEFVPMEFTEITLTGNGYVKCFNK